MGLFSSFDDKVQSALEKVRGQFPNSRINAKAADEVVTLTGHAPDLDTKTRIMAAFNEAVETKNIINQIGIDAPAAAIGAGGTRGSDLGRGGPIGVTSASELRTHEVASGETLTALAQRYYGDASQFRRIFDANRDQLSDPDKIRVGQKLKIPV